MTSPQQSMEAELAALGPTGFPVFVIRHAGCGCRLGAVHQTRLAGYVVAGRRQGAMRPDFRRPGVMSVRAWYLQSLERPSQPEWWGCKHAEGLLNFDELLSRARDTQATGPHVIE